MSNRAKIVIERTYRATAQEVLDLWTTKVGFESWWGPQGFRARVHELDARVGGAIRYDMIADTPEMIAMAKQMGRPRSFPVSGRFTELAPRRLVVTGVIDFLPGVAPYHSDIAVDLVELGDRVRMVVTLDAMHSDEFTRMQEEGFTSQLTKLDERLRGVRPLILKMSISLDGFVGGPNGENDWTFASRSADGKAWVGDTLREAGVLIMGRRSYTGWTTFWPISTDELAAPMNEIPKVVFSRSPHPELAATTAQAVADARRMHSEDQARAAASWDQARIASGDLTDEIARLKSEPGKPILALGGAGFARSLVATGLIDEYRLVIHPAVLGRGLALFSELPKPLALTLVGTTRFAAGAIAHVLRPAPI